nr:hypothetical protein [Citrobacter sp. 172116965]
MFAGKKSAQIREILISESAWEEMTCLFAPSLGDRQNAENKIKIIANQRDITLVNPTPFFITVADIVTSSGHGLINEGVMVAPKSRTTINAKQQVGQGESVVLQAISDYGGIVEHKTIIN